MLDSNRWRLIFLLALILLTSTYFLYTPDLTGELSIDDPRFSAELPKLDFPVAPSIVRFVSKSANNAVCFGLVIKAPDGVPEDIFNLTRYNPRLGSTLESFTNSAGFEIAAELYESGSWAQQAELVETILTGELADRILAPVDASLRQLSESDRYVVGVGFNYLSHREETDSDADKFAFAKPVIPTGAYAPLTIDIGQQPLIDYEAEIGFVLLADFDLSQPIDAEWFWNNVAFFTANDVTDRRPIVLDGDQGFTRGKTGAGFLPVGPWLVHGRHLKALTKNDDDMTLRLWLRIEESIDQMPMFRQNSNTSRMIRGPREILAMLPDIHAVSSRTDSSGKVWDIAKKDNTGISLPFGSILLSGTPHGTAIEAPDGFDRLRLITRGRFSSSLARDVFVGHLVRYRKEMGYLSEGDIVETGVEVLGVQRWVVQQ